MMSAAAAAAYVAHDVLVEMAKLMMQAAVSSKRYRRELSRGKADQRIGGKMHHVAEIIFWREIQHHPSSISTSIEKIKSKCN